MANHTSHSEFGKLKELFIKHVDDAFVDQALIDKQWQSLNYLDKPNMTIAQSEYLYFEEIFKQHKVNLRFFSSSKDVTIDSLYCRDASIVTDHGLILCNMGKHARKGEPKACRKDYEMAGLNILGEIRPPGILEGGDVAWLDQNTLAIAHGYRSNDEGFNQLKQLLSPFDIQLIQVDLPHYKGMSDVFHLMSIFSPIDKHKAVVYSALMPVRFRNELLARGFQLVEVPEEEYESMGCNVLAIEPSVCIMVKGNPITKSRLEQSGVDVKEYDGRHISVFGGGGPTCLTRPILRMLA